MSRTQFGFDLEAAPAVSFVLYNLATVLLLELARTRGPGEWFDKIKNDMKNDVKGLVTTAVPMENEIRDIEASLGVIDAVFNRVKWADENDSKTVD